VLVVGHLGDWRRAAAVLFERTSLRRDIAPSAPQGKEPSAYFESSLAQYREGNIGGTLKASGGVLGGGSETFLTQKVYETHPADSRVREMGETCQTVISRWGTGGGSTASGPKVMQDFRVRRLTPIECERLQGFPDNFTNIPWRKKDTSPDGPRYKALGNSMAVPVMQWIGDGIDMIDKL
jgi:DNA (cytosine-5)-methyltransferase 1